MPRTSFILSFGLLAVGCGGGGMGDDGAGADAEVTSYNCAAETRADTFSLGLEKMGAGGLLDFKLMTADPAPPARGNNAWTIEVDSAAAAAAGTPVSGLESTMKVSPYMPDHMHGTAIKVEVTAGSAAGQYDLNPVNLWMPGLWQTTIEATDGAQKDHAVFSFCISS